MEKKFYMTPEMEELDLKIESYLQTMSGGDPEFDPEPISGGVTD